jgi:hypothetical protein
MNCGDLMTRDPKCCLPSDTAVRAAKIMKMENVGADFNAFGHLSAAWAIRGAEFAAAVSLLSSIEGACRPLGAHPPQ